MAALPPRRGGARLRRSVCGDRFAQPLNRSVRFAGKQGVEDGVVVDPDVLLRGPARPRGGCLRQHCCRHPLQLCAAEAQPRRGDRRHKGGQVQRAAVRGVEEAQRAVQVKATPGEGRVQCLSTRAVSGVAASAASSSTVPACAGREEMLVDARALMADVQARAPGALARVSKVTRAVCWAGCKAKTAATPQRRSPHRRCRPCLPACLQPLPHPCLLLQFTDLLAFCPSAGIAGYSVAQVLQHLVEKHRGRRVRAACLRADEGREGGRLRDRCCCRWRRATAVLRLRLLHVEWSRGGASILPALLVLPRPLPHTHSSPTPPLRSPLPSPQDLVTRDIQLWQEGSLQLDIWEGEGAAAGGKGRKGPITPGASGAATGGGVSAGAARGRGLSRGGGRGGAVAGAGGIGRGASTGG